MVTGFTKFKEKFQGFEDQYVVNDVFRLGQLITLESRQALEEEIASDMKRFLDEMEKETINMKALGIRGLDQKQIIALLRSCYGVE